MQDSCNLSKVACAPVMHKTCARNMCMLLLFAVVVVVVVVLGVETEDGHTSAIPWCKNLRNKFIALPFLVCLRRCHGCCRYCCRCVAAAFVFKCEMLSAEEIDTSTPLS
eukprot:TRINITY_DN10705_c0_g1_i1.p1 TRINITY_DN10705_c0_g1~~TRINITY_DN10705_c0_g1_i1.p1  ORF type:complete len:109 (-),score=4.12 TRINITY_DN10705_c0_g1_i1:344-670(-)